MKKVSTITGIRERIVLFTGILLVVIQVVTYSLINTAVRSVAERQSVLELDAGEELFKKIFSTKEQQLIASAEVLAISVLEKP